MLEIVAAIYIVKTFYTHANESGRTGWAYGLLGFVLFYGIALCVTLGISFYLVYQDPYTEMGIGTTFLMSIISILIAGGLTMYVIFPFIKRQHSEIDARKNRDTLDSGLIE